MKRFLIFTLLFPPLALAVFTAPDGFRNLLNWLGHAYLIAMLLAWLTMAVDWKLSAKPTLLRIMGTTFAGAVMAGSIVIVLGMGNRSSFHFSSPCLSAHVRPQCARGCRVSDAHDAILPARDRCPPGCGLSAHRWGASPAARDRREKARVRAGRPHGKALQRPGSGDASRHQPNALLVPARVTVTFLQACQPLRVRPPLHCPRPRR
jgi:hypothetical protein